MSSRFSSNGFRRALQEFDAGAASTAETHKRTSDALQRTDFGLITSVFVCVSAAQHLPTAKTVTTTRERGSSAFLSNLGGRARENAIMNSLSVVNKWFGSIFGAEEKQPEHPARPARKTGKVAEELYAIVDRFSSSENAMRGVGKELARKVLEPEGAQPAGLVTEKEAEVITDIVQARYNPATGTERWLGESQIPLLECRLPQWAMSVPSIEVGSWLYSVLDAPVVTLEKVSELIPTGIPDSFLTKEARDFFEAMSRALPVTDEAKGFLKNLSTPFRHPYNVPQTYEEFKGAMVIINELRKRRGLSPIEDSLEKFQSIKALAYSRHMDPIGWDY